MLTWSLLRASTNKHTIDARKYLLQKNHVTEFLFLFLIFGARLSKSIILLDELAILIRYILTEFDHLSLDLLGQLVHENLEVQHFLLHLVLEEFACIVAFRLNHLDGEDLESDVGESNLVATWHCEDPLDISHRTVSAAESTRVFQFFIVEELLQESCLRILIEGV